jgi:hypothetical protein
MKQVTSLACMHLAAALTSVSAAALGIGIAMSEGTFSINKARTAGNATLFDGSTIETGSAFSRLKLNNGTTIRLSSNARGTVYGNRLVLEKGAIQIGGSKYQVKARTLNIVGRDARIGVFGKMVEVIALSSPVRVTNAQGVLVADVKPGKPLDFTPLEDAAPAAPEPGMKSQRANGRR